MVESKSEDSDTTAKSAEVSLYVLSFHGAIRSFKSFSSLTLKILLVLNRACVLLWVFGRCLKALRG